MGTDKRMRIPEAPQVIEPDWPAPKHIKAFTTLRSNDYGHSQKPYDSFNLGTHVNDDPKAVVSNRQMLYQPPFNIPNEPLWLNQVHGVEVAEFTHENNTIIRHHENLKPITADVSVAFKPNQVCVVLTADCLPLLVCNKQGNKVAAIHAGWRGLASGVIEAAIEKMYCKPEDLLVWLGPAIGPDSFEVGEEVLTAFGVDITDQDLISNKEFKLREQGFRPRTSGKYLADIYCLARQRLNRLGIHNHAIFGGDHCTYNEKELFYSYRRDKVTGRIASLIWIATTN